MRIVYLISADNKAAAEDLLKKDDIVSRASINIRSCGSLDSNEDGFFFILSGSEEQLSRAAELLKGKTGIFKDQNAVLATFDNQESLAVEGFGGIFG